MSRLSGTSATRAFASASVAGEEHVQRLVLGQDAAEDRVERLHDVCAVGGGGGDLLGHRVARRSSRVRWRRR